jgi:CheY-like chemotaxis protein
VGEQSHRPEGTGLGLAISRQLVQMMGGELKVKSTLGEGSVFWLDLDLPEVSLGAKVTDLDEGNIIGFKGDKRKVLVVDDHWANRSVLVNLLEPLGFEILEATNGREAFSKAREFKPDLIFMDLVMPVLDGFEATRRIRMLPELKEVVVIAISASVFDFDQQQSQEVGCDDFIPKPIREAELLEKLRAYLGLEWIYEKDVDATTATQRMKDEANNSLQPGLRPASLTDLTVKTSIVVPSEQDVAVLLDLAMMGDLKGIVEQAARLEALDRQWGPFATHLRQLAKSFKGKQILEFLKNIKRQNEY